MSILCLPQDARCKYIIDSLNAAPFEKKPQLSHIYKKIYLTKEDTMGTIGYKGLVNQFNKENYLIMQSSAIKKYMVKLQSCISYLLLDWQINELYTKKGSLVRRTTVFYNKLNSGEAYIFNKQKKAVRVSGLGDTLFKMKIEDFIKVLEENNITPQTTKIRTSIGQKFFMYKHITPSGCFWEFRTNNFYSDDPTLNICILISDVTKKVIVKSFDADPRYLSPEREDRYDFVRDSIVYGKDVDFKLDDDKILEILNKKKFNGSTSKIEKYENKTWLIQTDYNKDRNAKPMMLLIDDITGEILIDIDAYPKDLDGEEKFIQDFNKILIERTKKNVN